MKSRFQPKTASRRKTARITQKKFKDGQGSQVEESVTINRSPEELYSFWRHFENLPQFMSHVESVVDRGDGTSHWIIKTSMGKELEWDARIIEDRPNEMISWQSLQDAEVDNAGSVWFVRAPGGRATTVRVKLRYDPPGGKLGTAFAKLTGQSAEKQIAEDLARFKELMETGKIDD
jgi:uncharacterized membrane protein